MSAGARGVRRSRADEEEESYFISMSDMMVGLLFVFLILLLYFALQFQQKSKALTDAGETRTQILHDIRDEIRREDPTLKVEVDEHTGVLRLPAQFLFRSGEFVLSGAGQRSASVVAHAMARVLPCYTFPRAQRGCSGSPHSIDAIFIEGHTDSDALNGTGPLSDNMDLSALRATSTFRAIRDAAPALLAMRNLPNDDPDSSPILSVSGYGADRPVPNNTGSDDAAKQRNRRIDLRFLMESPRENALSGILTGGR